eukprot:gene17798-biopygen41443
MCRRGKYVFYDENGGAHVIESADGVDQGAPMSPPAFAFGLRRPLRNIRARIETLLQAAIDAGDITMAEGIVKLLSYLDDLTLLAPERLMGTAMHIAGEELAAVGLIRHDEKSLVWTKSGRCPPGCAQWWRNSDGFVIVGAPFGRLSGSVGDAEEDGEQEVDHDVVEVALGSPAFCRRFLDKQIAKVQDLIDRVVELPTLAGAHQPAVQVANLLLRYCVSSKVTHLLRLLPPPCTADFCKDIDERVVRAFCAINDVEEHFGDVQRHLYSTPMAWGGLGFRPLHDVRNAAFVGAWLHCMAHIRTHHGPAMPGFDAGWDPGGMGRYSFHGEYRCALDALNTQLGLDTGAYDVLGCTLPDVLQREQPKCQKLLSRAVLAQQFAVWKDSLGPRSRALAVLHAASSEGRRPLASEWLVTAPFGARTTIPDAHYRIAIRKRLDMPICNRGDACRVQKGMGRLNPSGGGMRIRGPRSHGHPCGAFLMPHADHAQACAMGARASRHDAIADLCASIHQEAGHSAHRETEVPGVLSKQNHPIRADVLVRARAPATWECAEIKVRHCFNSDGDVAISDAADLDAELRSTEAAVHAHYRPVKVRPWVMTSLGRPGEGFCADLRRLARLRLRRDDVARAVSLPSVLQYLLHRWRAELS